MRFPVIYLVGFLASGFCCGNAVLKSEHLVSKGVHTVGTVVDFEPQPNSVRPSARSVIQFHDDNKVYKFKPLIGARIELYPGKEVPVVYDPENPQVVSVDSPLELYCIASLFGACAAVTGLITLVRLYDMYSRPTEKRVAR